MPRSSRRSDGPVYREVLAHAFHTAWHEARFWPLAFFAALLFTAGSYDVVLAAYTRIRDQGTDLLAGVGTPSGRGMLHALSSAVQNVSSVLHIAMGVEATIVVAALLIALLVFSCVSQGGLVFALGTLKRGGRPTVSESIRVGGTTFWPVAALNALMMAGIWILRFFAALPLVLALDHTTVESWSLYLVSFLVFVTLSFVLSIVQVFALNGIVLQGATVHDAIARGYTLFKKHWVVTVETAVILFCISVVASMLLIGLFLLLSLPLFALFILSGLTQSALLFAGVKIAGVVLLFASMFAGAAFMTQFQYATWTFLYRRLGEGGVLPKLHRLARAISGSYAVR